MSKNRVLVQDYPKRTLVLTTSEHALIFRYNSTEPGFETEPIGRDAQRCLVEFASLPSIDLTGYRTLGYGYGTLGLITLDRDVFLCVITGASGAATVRPGETVSRIEDVDFYCLNHAGYEHRLDYDYESSFVAEEFSQVTGGNSEHPFLALKKLLSDGSFYYSLNFNLTDRLQDRSDKSGAFDIESLDKDMLWNLYMIHPLLVFRDHLSSTEKLQLDSSQILTCVIRGFCYTLTIPASVPVLPSMQSRSPSILTIISRQSSCRAGTRFNSRGIDDDGHVANFVETETILWIPSGIAFSYVQIRGSVPVFWEQATGFLPGQQKIDVTRSSEATQHAFDKHFESLELEYGAIHVVNLLSLLRPGEAELINRFREQIKRTPLNQRGDFNTTSDHALLRMTEFDVHAEARGPLGYGVSGEIKHELLHSLHGFAYFLTEDVGSSSNRNRAASSSIILQQEGVFRTNCLDCLDRTNLVQTVISAMALEFFLQQHHGNLGSEIQARHSTLWADNGDALSKIYAGTGALKSSFTRHGKMSLAGALADARKTAARLYINNFSDKARQRTIELLLGRLTDQSPVRLYDPINDIVSSELNQHASEYSFSKSINIWAGTFNVNGRPQKPDIDLTPWLFPKSNDQRDDPIIFAIGFQEIVELNAQQIMSTDPTTRKCWEVAVGDCLNSRAASRGSEKYVLLRTGQLVGAALMIYVRESALKEIKNVEGSVKKTGLSGIAGNKGGCAIRFEYSSTRICFVTAHLAAGFANYDERNRDYDTISAGLRFQMNRSIKDHDTIIWLGDFNYRIGLNNQNVRDLVAQRNFQRLYDNDQLNLQMLAGRAFQYYTEGQITFPPTYKYDIGSDDYDTSEKARVPAWCDRVLWKGSNLRQLNYDVANLWLSDHRPVWASFTCIISVVDEGRKDALRRSLYAQRRNDAFDLLSNTSQNDHLATEYSKPFESLSPELPAPSSDHHKWWLDNRAPVKSAIRPPCSEYVLNAHRTSNPFSSERGPDWVSELATSSKPERVKDSRTTRQRPQLPPRFSSSDHSTEPEGQTSHYSKMNKSQDKTPPPVPRKPPSLGAKQSLTMTPSTTHPKQDVHPGGRLKDGPSSSALGQASLSTATHGKSNIPSPPTHGPKPQISSDQKEVGMNSNESSRRPMISSPNKPRDLLDTITDDEIKWSPLTPKSG